MAGTNSKINYKNLPPVLATAKGHLNQEKQNLHSAKSGPTYADQLKKIRANIKKMKPNLLPGKSFRTALKEDIFDNAFPQSDDKNMKTNEVMFKLFETSETGITYDNQTGRFPYCSSQGNEYIMVACHYGANVILLQPVKNRQAATLTTAWNVIHNRLVTAGVTPKLYII